ncbi:M48 family metalloprotease [Kaarinaea lacus]
MSESSFRLVFQGKIAPEQDLAQVKSRLQKLFNKDATTIDRMFSGKKVALKQGLSQAQAQQYQEKMRSLGVLCDIEPQSLQSTKEASVARTITPSQPASTAAVNQYPSKQAISAGDTQKPLKLADIDKAFTGTIPRVELPNSYKAGIVAVGITMVLLPLIYIGIIAMMGYGVLSHAVSNVSWMQSLGYKFGLVAYVTPIIVGLTVILFMIKPLFARPAAAATTIKLDSLKEPIFFHFVNKIALAVGAPRPKQIEVDCQVNASASFRKGLFSFIGDDLVLTIGMPLLDGFNSRQLAGVLAHEFGHFSQGAGMRFHYLTYKVNSWFFNAVYLRDSWDEKLEQAAEEAEGWISVILNFARGGVWATRKVLYGFMMAGQVVSSYMLRQMELDADRYEAHMAGSEQFKDTTLQLQRLGVAFQVSHDQLAQAWEDKKLVDNLPRLIAHNATQLPDELDRALLSQIQEAKTQVYDSHPSDNERIDNAMRQQAKGIFSLARESRDLFKSFDAIAKQVSYAYYAHELGLEVDKNKLVDVNQVVQITKENEKQQEAYHQYFRDMAPVFELPISVNIFDTSKVDWDELLDQYQGINDQIVEQIAPRRKLMTQANESYDKYQKLLAIDIFRDCGFVMFPEWFGMDEQTFAKYREMIPKLEQTWQQSMEQLQHMFALNDQRLSIALTLLNHPILMERNPDHAQHLKARNRLSLLINNFKRNAEYVTDFEFAYFKLDALLSCAPLMGQKPDAMSTVMNGLLENIQQSYDQLTAALGRLDYPFVAEGEHLTIADYIADFLPHKNHCASDLQYYMQCGEITLEKLEFIYARIISGLANIALTMDRLIPGMNEPYYASEQVQVQQQVANGSPLDMPSTIGDQQNEQTPATVALSSEEPALPTTPDASVIEPVRKAVFAIDENEKKQDASQVFAQPEERETAATDTNTDKEAEATSAPTAGNAPEFTAPTQENNAAPVAGGLSLEEAPTNTTSNKAVFATDDSTDTIDVPEEKPALAQEPAKKAVFAIDDPMDKAEEEDEPSQENPVADPDSKAVFAIDESENKPGDEGMQNLKTANETAESSDMLNIGVAAVENVTASTPAVEAVESAGAMATESGLESAGLSLEPSNVAAEAVDSLAATAEPANEASKQDTAGLSLLLEPVASDTLAETISDTTVTHSKATDETESIPSGEEVKSTTLSLESQESLPETNVATPEGAGTSLSLEPRKEEAPEESSPIDAKTESESGQDSLVTESKAAVLSIEPIAKSREAATPLPDASAQALDTRNNKTGLEPNNQQAIASPATTTRPVATENKNSDEPGTGLSVQSK